MRDDDRHVEEERAYARRERLALTVIAALLFACVIGGVFLFTLTPRT